MSIILCTNCGWKGDESKLTHTVAEGNVPNLEERVDPGEEMPVGECPDCGCLAHYMEKPEPEKKTILLVMDVERMFRHGGQVRVPVEAEFDSNGEPIITSDIEEEAKDKAFAVIGDAYLEIFDSDPSSDYAEWAGKWEEQ